MFDNEIDDMVLKFGTWILFDETVAATFESNNLDLINL